MRVAPQNTAVLAVATLLACPCAATAGENDLPDIWTALRT